jgi:hypothetical protein
MAELGLMLISLVIWFYTLYFFFLGEKTPNQWEKLASLFKPWLEIL